MDNPKTIRPKTFPENAEEKEYILSPKCGPLPDITIHVMPCETLHPEPATGSHLSKEEVGRLIASLRRKKGLTQTQLAASLGIAQATVARFEKGRRDPTLGTIAQYERALGGTFKIVFEPE